MREIIDFHVHPFFKQERNVCFYNNTVDSIDAFVVDMKRAGITRMCGSVIERMDVKSFEAIRELNNEALLIADRLQGFYIPGIHIHPAFVEESIEELYRVHDLGRLHGLGVRLVGELVPYFMGWESYYDDNIHRIYSVIDKLNMVVSLHTQQEESIEQAVSTFPGITFVAAHPGDKASLLRHLDRIKRYDNYYLDLSGTGIFRYGLIKYAVEQVGSERLLFGSDYPICNPGMYVNAVLFEQLKDRDYDNIFSANAKRILGLE